MTGQEARDDGGIILVVTWDEGASMPPYIGPFESEADAKEFARLNVPNGVASVERLSRPYLRPQCICYSTRSSRCRAHEEDYR